MATSVGGTGSAPSPGWLLRAAVASCVTTLIAMRAATLDVALDSLAVTVDSESTSKAPCLSKVRLRSCVKWGSESEAERT